MRSMTGFGQASGESPRLRVQVTVRAVNHRYLDLVMRLRDDLRVAERRLRDVFTGHLERGRVEVSMEIERLGETPVRLVAHRGLAAAVRQLLEDLGTAGLSIAEPRLADLLRLPDAVRVDAEETAIDDQDLQLVIDTCRRAAEQVVASRQLEGGELRQALASRVEALGEVLDVMVLRAAGLPAQLAEALEQRLEQLLADRVDADRVAQEVAHLADRMDVSEELDRLGSHLVHFREMLDAEGAVGKRMDFLAQEVFRELNTIGSKCRDSELVRSVLDGKVLCEQLREQVQNVE